MRTSTLGYILAAVFFAVGIIGSLGEWVFHWWDQPFEWLGPLSLVLGGVTLMWSASARDVERLRADLLKELGLLRKETVAGQDRLAAGQDRMATAQAEQTALLREVVASFRQA